MPKKHTKGKVKESDQSNVYSKEEVDFLKRSEKADTSLRAE